jgi:Ser/Thr protein kinase RdoA (MazF antagonist)
VPIAAVILDRAKWAVGCWRAAPGSLEPLATGFSGSPVFRVEWPAGEAGVLKAFAAGTSRERACWVHALVTHLRAAGLTEVPAVLPLPDGTTLLTDRSGWLWELSTFVPGESLAEPTPDQLAAALGLVARVHATAAILPGHAPARGPSRGLTTRVARARQLLASPWADLAAGFSTDATSAELESLLRPRLLAAAECFAAADGSRALAKLSAWQPPQLTCQVVLRDLSRDHVLFAEPDSKQVAGLIDLHAAGCDTPATDLARLLGSWLPAGGEVAPKWWTTALAAGEAQRPLELAARAVVPLLAGSGILFGLDNWFRWVLVEGRGFDDAERVVARVDWLLERLPGALGMMRHTPFDARSDSGLTAEKGSS